jgi:hypothetical protein
MNGSRTFLTGKNAHSVDVNPVNNQIFVPIEDPNPLCGTLPGCVSVFTDAHPRRPLVRDSEATSN